MPEEHLAFHLHTMLVFSPFFSYPPHRKGKATNYLELRINKLKQSQEARRFPYVPSVVFQFSLRRGCFGPLLSRMVIRETRDTSLSVKGFRYTHEDLS